jgi:hypothetical protein
MRFFYTITFLLFFTHAWSQDLPVEKEKKDTVRIIKAKTDTSAKKQKNYSPALAATRSAIIPGWGQVYNKKYWKVPIIWGGLGITVGVFNYNLKNYKSLKQAYSGKYNARVNKDSTEYWKINPVLMPLSEESLRYNRDQFRQNIDYSVLFFLLIWGLNVVDAAVDAHLKPFDVSPDLSLYIKPGTSDMAKTNGLSLVLTFK